MNKPTHLKPRIASLILIFCAALLARPCFAAPGQWTPASNLSMAREFHTATVLPNGKVLVAGGWIVTRSRQRQPSSTIRQPGPGLRPAVCTWRASGIPLLLPSGLVLVAGGGSDAGSEATAELYDPATGAWSLTGSLNQARSVHSSALLANGKVLVAGGSGLKSAELYDPATGSWTTTGTMVEKRLAGLIPLPLTVLNTGKALLEGGYDTHGQSLRTAELYDPVTGVWSLTGNLNTAREEHTATLLPNGMVLVAGGYNTDVESIDSAELYDPATGVWTNTGSMAQDRNRHTAALLQNGMVLVAGGLGYFDGFLTETELYDPATGTWTVTGSMTHPRSDHREVVLPSGMVLVEGGGTPYANDTAEVYDPGTTVTATQVSGRGSITGQGDRASFVIRGVLSGERASGSVTFSDPAAGISLARAKVRTLTFNGNSADLSGTGGWGTAESDLQRQRE